MDASLQASSLTWRPFALGLSEAEMRDVALALSRHFFYKSMAIHADHKSRQDVYHGVTEDGAAVYIKITAYPGGRPPVIQFKVK